MISIVTCSIDEKNLSQLKKSIEESIGTVSYEHLIFDNREARKSIAEVYNWSIRRSKYSYLLFLHEDIVFKTNDWGQELVNLFMKNEKIGLIGLAGSTIKLSYPSYWADVQDKYHKKNIVQQRGSVEVYENVGWLDSDKEFQFVATIDGVFIGMRKNGIFFNELLTGFHGYDMSISVENYINNYQTVVTNKILILHKSLGNKNNDWLVSMDHIHELYKKHLPIQIDGNEELDQMEDEMLKKYTHFAFDIKNKQIAYKYAKKIIFGKTPFHDKFVFLKRWLKLLLLGAS